jgi:hypothetical protein
MFFNKLCDHSDVGFQQLDFDPNFNRISNTAFTLINQCCGAEAARSRIFWPEPELEPECRSFGSGSGSA